MPNTLKPETKRVLQRELGELDAQIDAAKQELAAAEKAATEKKQALQALRQKKDDLTTDLT